MSRSGDAYSPRLYGFQTLGESMHNFAAGMQAVAEQAMREGRKSDPMVSASHGHGVLSSRGRAQTAGNCENVSSANGGQTSSTSAPNTQRGCLSQSARPGQTAGGKTGNVASSGVVSMAGSVAGVVLGDITNMVHASRALGKVPKAFSFLHPQSQQQQQQQPMLGGAVPVPAPVPAAPAAPSAAPPSLSATGPAVMRIAPPVAAPARRDEPACPLFENDVHDPQRVSEYAPDIFTRLFETEADFMPKPDYMEEQKDINGKMRAILIDWLVEVHMKFRLRPETLYLTVNIIDRYLSKMPVMRKKLQLLGVVAMFIAAKYEEIDLPKVHEFAYITDHTYSKKEIVNMEAVVLMALEYQIAVPTPVHFLDRLQRINGCDAVHRSLVQYILELGLLDLRNVRYPPSVLVGAAILVSNEYLGRRQTWSDAMARHFKRPKASVWACAADMRVVLDGAKTASLQAVRRKYQLDLNLAVANLSPVRQRD